ncbi:hypothetical protein NDU88_005654 [Pleurodeles waltl]|uniref:Uncharacterized protein n=1 Tax=Pleurodeles waltl TaxID=8319 RepID=A0AAV7QJN3_PLEWA|nr:hypothetical protein NDU88_005654 [Pleurodeles waltl]
MVSQECSSKHNHRKDLAKGFKERWSVTPWVEEKPAREVLGTSGTRAVGQDKGKEVPRDGYGAEAQGCGFEGMDLDYIEDSPEEGEIVEGESDKKEGQGEVEGL